MRETPNTTALLIEYGFIDNPRDAAKLQNNITDYAEGVVKAVSEYIGIPYTAPNSEVEGDVYTVRRGDNLYAIARRFNTTVSELKRLNNLSSDNLSIGQTLRIPGKEQSDEYELYTIQEGDSLYTVANKFNISINDLIDFNALPTTILTVGETIKIPKANADGVIKENVYIVKPGDTLYRIANIYGVPINDLITANNLSSNILTIGQKIIIPIKPVTEEDYVVYQVVNGDTLYSIARRFNTRVDAIKAYNNLSSNILNVGQILQIPIENTESLYQTYSVNPGDTLYSIARRFNTTVADIMALNQDISSILSIGQVIKIPQQK